MNQKLLCIELNSMEIRVCEIKHNTKNDSIALLNSFTIPANGNIGDSEIYELDSLAYSIKEGLSEHGIKTKKCIVSINSNEIFSRSVTIPYQKSSQEILELVNAKVENDAIFSAADLAKSITTYSILEKVVHCSEENMLELDDKKKKKKKKETYDYNLMLYNAPHSLILGIVQLIHDCKLKLLYVNYSGNSIYQYIRKTHTEGTFLTVYLNDTNSVMAVIKDGVMVSQKTDEFSYTKIAKKLVDNQEVTGCKTLEDALHFINESRFFEDDYKINEALLESQKDTFYYMRQEIIDDIVGFFDVIKAYLTSTRNMYPVDSIIYICNNETFPDLTESIKANIEIDVETYSKDDLGYSLALLDCVNACISPVNFNIEESNKLKENRKVRQYTVVGLVFSIWISALYVGYNIFMLSNLKIENKRLENDIQAANDAQEVFNNYQQSANTRETIETFDATSSTILNELDLIIKELEDAVPTNKLHIESFTCSLEGVSLSVRADSKDTVAYFLENLEKIEYFTYVDTPSVSESITEEGGESSFTTGREVLANITCSFLEKETEESTDEYVTEEDMPDDEIIGNESGVE